MTFPRPKEVMRSLLTITLVLAFCGALAALFRYTVPEANVDLVNFMLGQLSILTAGAVGYWINTSKSSSDKNEILANRPSGMPDDPVHVEDDTLDLKGYER